MQPSSFIYDAATECHQGLVECQRLRQLTEGEWAEIRLADFNLWASGMGALLRNKMSLDGRLSLRADARDTVKNLLQLLQASVGECISLGMISLLSDSESTSNVASCLAQREDDPGNQKYEEETKHDRSDELSVEAPVQRSFSPWSDYSCSDSQSDVTTEASKSAALSQAMRNVDLQLDQLARIAVTIRRVGTRSRLQKADRLFKPDDHRELQDHLTAVLLIQRPLSQGFAFGRDDMGAFKGELTDVQRRLIHCNLKRRNRFLHAQTRSNNLAPPLSSLQPFSDIPEANFHIRETGPTPSQRQSEPMRSFQRGQESDPTLVSKTNEREHNRSIRTGTSASGVTDLLPLSQNPVPSQATSTQLSKTIVSVDYPRPPKMNPSALVFKCPACCQTLPAMFADKTRWKYVDFTFSNTFTLL